MTSPQRAPGEAGRESCSHPEGKWNKHKRHGNSLSAVCMCGKWVVKLMPPDWNGELVFFDSRTGRTTSVFL